ncbi:GGDEF domain-containing protein [Haloechinothrix sp. LS1_15]|nr:GGDEF domain-containing protein [Haloechinothrix sp. LS1_15]
MELHESIATLLASQRNWEAAYAHLQIALRLARDHDCAALRLPEQHQREVAELRRAHEQAIDASMRDELTATYNRRYLHKQLVCLLAEQSGIGCGVAIALVDLDHFKAVNDTYGHALGDTVLQQVVSLLQANLPEGAFCARYGGEEFVLVLPDVGARQAVTVVERARARVAGHYWPSLATGLHVTISAGLVHHTPSNRAPGARTEADAAERQLRRADDLLYAAKRYGRNAVAYRTDGAIRIAGLDDDCG